jgi:hypothetical protein
MKITNAYQAILAKLGGNTDVNIPAPKNKYEKLLNEIPANGSGSGGMVVRCNDDISLLDKTWNEIKTAAQSGTPIVIVHYYEGEPAGKLSFVSDVVQSSEEPTQYWIYCGKWDSYVCYAPDDYPEWNV